MKAKKDDASQWSIATLGALAPYLRRHWLKLLGGTLALTISSSLFFLIGIGLSRVTDQIATQSKNLAADLAPLMWMAVLVLTGYAVGMFLRNYLMRAIGQEIGIRLREDAFRRLTQRTAAFFDKNAHTEIQARLISDTSELQSVIGQVIPQAIHQSLLLFAGGAYAIWISPLLSVCVVLAVPAIFLPGILSSRAVANRAAARQGANATVGAYAAEMLRNVKLVQAMQYESHAAAQYSKHSNYLLGVWKRSVRLEALVGMFTSLLAFGTLVGLILVGAYQVGKDALSIGGLVAFVFYANLCVTAASQLVNAFVSLRSVLGAIGRTIQLRDAPIEKEEGWVAGPPDASNAPDGDIRLTSVGFQYPSRTDRFVLQDIDLVIRSGETIVIMGPSGSGKTALFDLLLKFYQPTSGSITVGGRPLWEISTADWRKRIALVPQQPELFSGSVLDNLRFGCPDASEEQAWSALDRAQIADFVRALPQGLHSDLGHDGLRLSGGQRQRLAIARALVREPQILFLDEPASALDRQNEASVQRALEESRRGRTTIMISHRLESAVLADRIVLLHHGRILAVGSHEELTASTPEYSALDFKPRAEPRELADLSTSSRVLGAA